MLRIGMIGAGFVAKFHCRALQSIRGAKLAGIHALAGAEELAALARELGIGTPQTYDSIADLCKNVDVVAMFIPNFIRLTVLKEIMAAIGQGAQIKGIICEKPLARNMAEAQEMVGLVGSTQTAYFENQIFMPAIAASRMQLRKVMDAMGSPHLSRSAEEHGGPHEPWFWDPTRQGGGVWCDMGCHSIAVGMYLLTPPNKQPDFLKPVNVTARMALLKWGKEPWISELKAKGVDYTVAPAEDYALCTFEFEDPETGLRSIAQATDSWMYDAPGLKLEMEVFGPGYNHTVNTLTSPAGIFISDRAAESLLDSELALEKAQATRGQLVIQPNEPILYGYVGEWVNALACFASGQDAFLNFAYGAFIAKLIMAGYMAHEDGMTLDFADIEACVSGYIPLIQRGEGAKVLHIAA